MREFDIQEAFILKKLWSFHKVQGKATDKKLHDVSFLSTNSIYK